MEYKVFKKSVTYSVTYLLTLTDKVIHRGAPLLKKGVHFCLAIINNYLKNIKKKSFYDKLICRWKKVPDLDPDP